MSNDIPTSLKAEHEHLHAELERATLESGALGEAARDVARTLYAHFAKEEKFAMPPLRLLTKLAWGAVTPEMSAIVPLSRRLKAELPVMLLEHEDILEAVHRFRRRAEEAGRADYERFADALVQHARTEEEVLYPAAVLVGEFVAMKLAEREPG